MRHDRIKKRMFGVVAALVAVVAVLLAVFWYYTAQRSAGEALPELANRKETIHLWYTDDALTDYLNSKTLEFYNNTDIRVNVQLVSGLEYLEAVNAASLDEEADTPDLYILSNDSLEKAYLAGLATQLPDSAPIYDEQLFHQAARNAVLYDGKYVACPLYFETSALLYNKTYLQQIADEANGAGSDDSEDSGENPEETAGQSVTADQLIPTSIVDILTFADQYSTPENVEYFFRWDVSDIFYNYFIVGNYIDVGGVNGDNADSIAIYNENAIRALRVYQNLNQFFSIDTKEISYDGVLQDFLDGKIVYTVATTDALSKLEKARDAGEFSYEYGVTRVPDVSEELGSASLSVTQCVGVNGYSTKKEMANDFAVYLTQYNTQELYARTGKLPVYCDGNTYDDPNAAAFLEEYARSVPIPKMIETSNFWVQLEIAFARIWEGEDANDELRSLSEQIMGQVLGEAYTEEYIDVPVPVEETEEEGEQETE